MSTKMGDSMKHLLNWKVGFCDSKEKRPNEYFPATVPGAVQLDYAKHYNLPDYRCEKNFEQFRWMEDKFWVYISELDMGSLNTNNNIFSYLFLLPHYHFHNVVHYLILFHFHQYNW